MTCWFEGRGLKGTEGLMNRAVWGGMGGVRKGVRGEGGGMIRGGGGIRMLRRVKWIQLIRIGVGVSVVKSWIAVGSLLLLLTRVGVYIWRTQLNALVWIYVVRIIWTIVGWGTTVTVKFARIVAGITVNAVETVISICVIYLYTVTADQAVAVNPWTFVLLLARVEVSR